jgi:ferredoxin-NADP reductase
MQWLEVDLLSSRQETSVTRSFTFALPNKFTYKPGQHIRMKLESPGDDRRGVRSFSIASSPTELGVLMITTIVRPQSAFKQRLASLAHGERVTIGGPMGNFILHEDPSKVAVMVCGGIGVTPIRSMIKYATDSRMAVQIVLLYSSKTPESILYRRELDDWEKANPKLRVIHTITRPESSSEKWNGLIGRISEAIIREHVILKDAIFYVCGPPSMVESMTSLLSNLNVPSEHVNEEEFTGY